MIRTLLVTLELPVRAMTEKEWTEAWDGCGHDEEETDGADREETLEECDAVDFTDAIAAALNSTNNPDVLAGSGLFVHTDDASVKSIAWKA